MTPVLPDTAAGLWLPGRGSLVFPDGIGDGITKTSTYFYFPKKIKRQICSKKNGQRRQGS